MNTVKDVRELFKNAENVNDTLDLQNVLFVGDEPNITENKPNKDYIKAEIKWYESQDLSTERLERYYGKLPKIWKDIQDDYGYINSNYGWAVFSEGNGFQFDYAIKHLLNDKNSRRAIMIYNRPSMHKAWMGMRDKEPNKTNAKRFNSRKDEDIVFDEYRTMRGDFMCCQNNTLAIRNNKLSFTVQMRSMDARFGYNNDNAWFQYLFDKAYKRLKATYKDLERDKYVTYFCNSLHIYL